MKRKYSRKKREEILSLAQANQEFFARMRRMDAEEAADAGPDEDGQASIRETRS